MSPRETSSFHRGTARYAAEIPPRSEPACVPRGRRLFEAGVSFDERFSFAGPSLSPHNCRSLFPAIHLAAYETLKAPTGVTGCALTTCGAGATPAAGGCGGAAEPALPPAA